MTLAQTLAAIPGREQEGLRDLEKAAEVEPDDPNIQANLAIVLARMGRSQDAIRHYRNALVIYPDFVGAHFGISSLLRTMPGMEVEASDELEAEDAARQRMSRDADEMGPH